jgi:hypothetical protein
MKRRGQTIVLGCVSLLTLSLAMMATYSVSNAVHQKIALQSQADAQSYSIAIVEARAMNLTTHYNRAIAAALVAEMSVHSYMALAIAMVDQLRSGRNAYTQLALAEGLLGCEPPVNILHCPCVAFATANATAFGLAQRKWGKQLQNLEQPFNTLVGVVSKMITGLSGSQNVMLGKAVVEIAGAGPKSVLTRLDQNAPRATSARAFRAMNEKNFVCSFEGSVIEVGCVGGVAKAALDDRSKVIQQAANAARPEFDWSSSGTKIMNVGVSPNWNVINAKVPRDTQLTKVPLMNAGKWVNEPFTLHGRGHVGDSPAKGGDAAREGVQVAKNAAAGFTSAGKIVIIGFQHIPTSFPVDYHGSIYSDAQGGGHTNGGFGGSGHQANFRHDAFKGDTRQDPCGLANCFINFRGDRSAANDFGQPSVYAGVTQDLRLYDAKTATAGAPREMASNAAWEINANGRVELKWVRGRTDKADLVPRGTGFAVSKAKVYFHQLGDWTVPPNLFDPFWRAKLHFFSRAEMTVALGAVGDKSGLLLKAPVEGE